MKYAGVELGAQSLVTVGPYQIHWLLVDSWVTTTLVSEMNQSYMYYVCINVYVTVHEKRDHPLQFTPFHYDRFEQLTVVKSKRFAWANESMHDYCYFATG